MEDMGALRISKPNQKCSNLPRASDLGTSKEGLRFVLNTSHIAKHLQYNC